VAESKLAEKTVEIDKIMEENRAMKESMDRINNHQILKPEASKFFLSPKYQRNILQSFLTTNFKIMNLNFHEFLDQRFLKFQALLEIKDTKDEVKPYTFDS
jgi:hypothetical protein